LSTLAASFAQGLQMTNILKDVWEDRSRGACWLPQEVFKRYGIDLGEIGSGSQPPRFDEAMAELIGLAHAHLRNALDYTLLIPAKETGIRRFCLWAIGLAILTLRKVAKNPGFTCGAQVKVTRAAVSMTLALSNAFVRNDWMLKKLFATAASGVPRGRIPEMHRMRPAPTIAAADTVAATAAATAVHEHELHRSYGSSGN
jgi:farnesyl-diphosphate farnesyltransferase